jgi:NAD(P)-dependent dehydrogenase (short-subunit alcohol dehydrogenase family)
MGKWAEPAGISTEKMRQRVMNDYPQKPFIMPDEIAATVLFLCKEESGAISGEDIRVTTGAMW